MNFDINNTIIFVFIADIFKSASSTMCTALMCRSNFTSSSCIAMPGGAVQGTTCGSGKVIVIT